MKLCKTCGLEKDDSEFAVKRKNDKVFLQSQCKACNRVYQKDHYKKNKSSYIDKSKAYRYENYDRLLEFLANKACTDCGNSDRRVLEFDHLSDKKGDIGTLVRQWSWASLLVEITKCEVVCCNCHRIRTLTRNKSRK